MPDHDRLRSEVEAHMPEKPRVGVTAYVEARLAASEEHVLRLLEHAIEKVKDEAWETRAWILLLTAASWGNLAANQQRDTTHVVAAAVTLGLVLLAGTFMVARRKYRRRRLPAPPKSQLKQTSEELEKDDET